MEIILESKLRTIGIDDQESKNSDLSYFSVLPDFSKSLGLVSVEALNRLNKDSQSFVNGKRLSSFSVINKGLITRSKMEYIVYDFKDRDPILYETWGYNCILCPKDFRYQDYSLLGSFLTKDTDFSEEDFDNLEQNTKYLIRSYYDGGSSTIFLSDPLLEEVIRLFELFGQETFNSQLCVEEP